MSVRNTAVEGVSAMFDSTSGTAFGPIFDNADELDDFLEFAGEHEERDLRMLPSPELDALVLVWRGVRARREATG